MSGWTSWGGDGWDGDGDEDEDDIPRVSKINYFFKKE